MVSTSKTYDAKNLDLAKQLAKLEERMVAVEEFQRDINEAIAEAIDNNVMAAFVCVASFMLDCTRDFIPSGL